MNLNEHIKLLQDGKIILYPTDTIWGIGCDATDDNACNRIAELKGRSDDKSFILLVDDFPMLERYVPDFNPVCYDLADFAEKPLTIIYPNAHGVSKEVLASDGSVGIRITKDPICLKLIRGLRKPIVSTSANISGMSSPKNFSEINQTIKDQVDGIVMQRLEEMRTTPSQILKIDLNGTIKIIRK